MKKIWTLATALVLTAALFTGCGCTNSNKGNASTPTGMTEPMPTILPTQAPTVPTTQATQPTTESTTSSVSTEGSSATEETLDGQARRTVPGSGSGTSSNSGSGMGSGTSGR